MINILQTELFRLKKSSLFWALLGVCAGLPLISLMLQLIVVIFTAMAFGGGEIGDLWALMHQTGATATMLTSLSGWSSDPALFSVICSSIVLSKEFSGGTVRNMLLANKSRKQLFFSFALVALIIGVSYFAIAFVAILLMQGTMFGFGEMSATEAVTACFSSLALGLLSIVAVQSCVCMFLFATRKTGATVACSIVVCLFAPSIIYTLVEVAEAIRMLMDVPSMSEAALGWIPLYNMYLYDASSVNGALVGKIVLYQAMIIAFFGGMGWLGIRKRDLK